MSHLGLPLSANDIETKIKRLLQKLIFRKIKNDNNGLDNITTVYFQSNEFRDVIKEYTPLLRKHFTIDTGDKKKIKNIELTIFKQFIKQIGIKMIRKGRETVEVGGKNIHATVYTLH